MYVALLCIVGVRNFTFCVETGAHYWFHILLCPLYLIVKLVTSRDCLLITPQLRSKGERIKTGCSDRASNLNATLMVIRFGNDFKPSKIIPTPTLATQPTWSRKNQRCFSRCLLNQYEGSSFNWNAATIVIADDVASYILPNIRIPEVGNSRPFRRCSCLDLHPLDVQYCHGFKHS